MFSLPSLNLPFWSKRKTTNCEVAPRHPTTGFFLFETKKTIYCPIPKNSSTFFKTRLIEVNGDQELLLHSQLPVHTFLRRTPKYWIHDLQRLSEPDYLSFAIIREPLERVVSAYLNKFVSARRHHPIQVQATQSFMDLIDDSIDPERSLTFRQFVRLICQQQDHELDKHWRPQTCFLQGQVDSIGWLVPQNQLDRFYPVFESHLGTEISKTRSGNRTLYKRQEAGVDVTRLSPRRLRNLGWHPEKDQFLVPELRERLIVRYEEDLALFKRACESFEAQF